MTISNTNTNTEPTKCLQKLMQNLTRKVDHAVAPKWWSQHDLLKLLKQYDTGLLNGGNFPRDNRQVQGLEMGPNIVSASSLPL